RSWDRSTNAFARSHRTGRDYRFGAGASAPVARRVRGSRVAGRPRQCFRAWTLQTLEGPAVAPTVGPSSLETHAPVCGFARTRPAGAGSKRDATHRCRRGPRLGIVYSELRG